MHLLKVTIPVILTLNACGKSMAPSSQTQEAWDAVNLPQRLGDDYIVNIEALPTVSVLATIPWSDDYWPSNRGGIARRWQDSSANAFTYKAPDLPSLRAMSESELAKLSPAEKFDIFNGDYDYATVTLERLRVSPRAEYWEGICHGWAPAAINFQEPKPVLLTNADGIKIPFAAADIKALLSYYQGQVAETKGGFLGGRCNFDLSQNPEHALDPSCRDTNAGSFHIVLANEIGLRKTSFVADVTRDRMVWNQPIFAFKSNFIGSQAPSPGAAPGTMSEEVVETTMWYIREVEPQWNAIVGTPQNSYGSINYRYRLELDRNRNIIGGAWESEERPDFLWTRGRPEFIGQWGLLETIYIKSINATPYPNPNPPSEAAN